MEPIMVQFEVYIKYNKNYLFIPKNTWNKFAEDDDFIILKPTVKSYP